MSFNESSSPQLCFSPIEFGALSIPRSKSRPTFEEDLVAGAAEDEELHGGGLAHAYLAEAVADR